MTDAEHNTQPPPAGGEKVEDARWRWFAGQDDEFYRCGPCDSREEAIAWAESDLDALDPIFVVEAIRARRVDLIPSGQDVLDGWIESFLDSDLSSENDDADLCGTDEERVAAVGALDAALKAWGAEHGHILPQPSRFITSRNAECVREGRDLDVAALASETKP